MHAEHRDLEGLLDVLHLWHAHDDDDDDDVVSAAAMLYAIVVVVGVAFVRLSPLFLQFIFTPGTSPISAVVAAAAAVATASAASASKCMHNSAPPSDELNWDSRLSVRVAGEMGDVAVNVDDGRCCRCSPT